MRRDEQIKHLKSQSFDVIVVGGGASGCGVALDAATRGLKVALVEKHDLSSGTSSRSTKLVHGGVRYLERAFLKFDRSQFNLVREALIERSTLFKIAPHLVRVLPIFTPIYSRIEIPYYLAGLKLYDRLAGRYGIRSSSFVSSKKAIRKFPMIRQDGLRGGVTYYDGQFDDARMNVSLALTAVAKGAVVANYVEVNGFLKSEGNIRGVKVTDRISGDSFEVKGKVVVNAAGPFVDVIRKMDDPNCQPMLSTSSGVHLILPKSFCPSSTGVLIPKTQDGRVLFVLPWLGHVLVGTTDRSATLEENPLAKEEDIKYILTELSNYFTQKVTQSDILSHWSGLRPLVSDPSVQRTSRISRDHVIHDSKSGLVTLAGGKWTTYRKMAADLVDHLGMKWKREDLPYSRTKKVPLVGAENYGPEVEVMLQEHYGLPDFHAKHLLRTYGDRALDVAQLAKDNGTRPLVDGLPHLEAEVVYAVENEGAVKAMDILSRRTRVSFLEHDATLRALPKVVKIMGEVLGWDSARQQQELNDVQEGGQF